MSFVKVERSEVARVFIGVPNQNGIPCKFMVMDDYGNLVIVPVRQLGFSLT